MPDQPKARKPDAPKAARQKPRKRKVRQVNYGKPAVNIGQSRVKAANNASPSQQLSSKITVGKSEKMLASYFAGLTSPDGPCISPFSIAEFELFTKCYTYVFNGVANATADGFLYIAAGLDGWNETGNDGGPYEQFLSYTTGGYPVVVNTSTSTATGTQGGTFGTSVGTGYQLPVLDPGFSQGERYHMTACIVEVWSDAPAQTAQGDITVAAVCGEEAHADLALNNTTFDTVAGFPQDYVSHAEFPLSNWKDVVSTHITPFASNCFVYHSMPATGKSTVPIFGLAVIGKGLADTQSVRYRITYKYEATMPKSYRFDLEDNIKTPFPLDQALPMLSYLRRVPPTQGPKSHRGGAGLLAVRQADPGLFGRIKNAASALVDSPHIGSALSFVPTVGKYLASGWGMLKSLFK